MAYKSTDATADIKATSTSNLAMGSTTLMTVHTTSSRHCDSGTSLQGNDLHNNTGSSPHNNQPSNHGNDLQNTVPSLHCDWYTKRLFKVVSFVFQPFLPFIYFTLQNFTFCSKCKTQGVILHPHNPKIHHHKTSISKMYLS